MYQALFKEIKTQFSISVDYEHMYDVNLIV